MQSSVIFTCVHAISNSPKRQTCKWRSPWKFQKRQTNEPTCDHNPRFSFRPLKERKEKKENKSSLLSDDEGDKERFIILTERRRRWKRKKRGTKKFDKRRMHGACTVLCITLDELPVRAAKRATTRIHVFYAFSLLPIFLSLSLSFSLFLSPFLSHSRSVLSFRSLPPPLFLFTKIQPSTCVINEAREGSDAVPCNPECRSARRASRAHQLRGHGAEKWIFRATCTSCAYHRLQGD